MAIYQAKLKRRHCPYCNTAMTRAQLHKHDPRKTTVDHVYPQAARQVNAGFTRVQRRLNEIKCCSKCNELKATRHPLRWLTVMPVFGVEAFARRLLDIGFNTPEDIMNAVKKREPS